MNIAKNTIENYPTIGYDVKARVVKSRGGWIWTVTIHVLGPDDILEKRSNIFNSKQNCTGNLMSQFVMVTNNLLSDF